MAKLLRMPGISADAEEVVFLEWCVNPGSSIKNGDAIAIVETEKANVDIVADQDAVLWRSLIEPGTSVNVGVPIAILLENGEKVNDEAEIFKSLGLESVSAASNGSSKKVEEKVSVEAEHKIPQTFASANALQGERVFASPIARKMAKENNISITNIVGTGPGQRIVRADVERSIANGSSSKQTINSVDKTQPRLDSGYSDIPHSNLRRAVARTLATSKREAPHFYLDATCRVDQLLELRKTINSEVAEKISINDLVFKAVVKTLVDVPEMNVIWMDECVRKFNSVDVAVAIGSSRGLVTPVIRSAEKLSLTQISAQIKDFAQRANDGKLKQHEIEGGVFSVTNLGMFGVEKFSAILNPPQVGILAVGAVINEPIAVDGQLQVGNTLKVTLSVDHRPVDGVLAAKWIQRFKTLIENPALIIASDI